MTASESRSPVSYSTPPDVLEVTSSWSPQTWSAVTSSSGARSLAQLHMLSPSAMVPAVPEYAPLSRTVSVALQFES